MVMVHVKCIDWLNRSARENRPTIRRERVFYWFIKIDIQQKNLNLNSLAVLRRLVGYTLLAHKHAPGLNCILFVYTVASIWMH